MVTLDIVGQRVCVCAMCHYDSMNSVMQEKSKPEGLQAKADTFQTLIQCSGGEGVYNLFEDCFSWIHFTSGIAVAVRNRTAAKKRNEASSQSVKCNLMLFRQMVTKNRATFKELGRAVYIEVWSHIIYAENTGSSHSSQKIYSNISALHKPPSISQLTISTSCTSAQPVQDKHQTLMDTHPT